MGFAREEVCFNFFSSTGEPDERVSLAHAMRAAVARFCATCARVGRKHTASSAGLRVHWVHPLPRGPRQFSSVPNTGEGSVFDVLSERGFVKEHTAHVPERLRDERVAFYVGFDPTADSLHVGSLVPLMAMAHLQRAGHRPIALVGGATGMVGDPSGKEEARQLLSREEIERNKECIRSQVERFVDMSDKGGGLVVDNADWLLGQNYVEFLRDFGASFSVNVMLTRASVKSRLEKGMSLLEFNYQILQALDYLELSERYGCELQIGGDDQWGNIVGGIDLVRRRLGKEVGALTFPLLTTAGGAKMGKTASGAVWLDAKRVSPYEYYQFWINTDDRDVSRFLRLFTFLPMDAIREFDALEGADLRSAKKALAFEATAIVHGEGAAREAVEGSEAAFSSGGDVSKMPQLKAELPLNLVEALRLANLCPSNKDARRTIASGAIRVNGEKWTDENSVLDTSALDGQGTLVLSKGKKKHIRVVAIR